MTRSEYTSEIRDLLMAVEENIGGALRTEVDGDHQTLLRGTVEAAIKVLQSALVLIEKRAASYGDTMDSEARQYGGEC